MNKEIELKMNNRAKKIYFNYSGNKFQMSRDGVTSEYLSYSVTKEKEKEWLQELIEIEFEKLDIYSINSFFPLWYIIEHHQLFQYFDRLEDFIKNNSKQTITKEKSRLFF